MLFSYLMKNMPSPLPQSYYGKSIRRRGGKLPSVIPLAVECLEDRTLLAFQALLAPTALSAGPNSAVSFDVQYQTQNDSGTPTALPSNGMTVRTFFSSAKLTFQSTTNTLQTDLFADTSMDDDTDNLDGDATTDKYLSVTWFNANSAFPTGTQPVRLLTANFTTAANFSGTTQVNFGGLPGANFQVKTSPLTITVTAAATLTATISSLTNSVTNVSPIPVTVQFSSSVTDFTLSDLQVTGGTVSDFLGSGANFTFNVTPSTQGTVTVNIPANVAQGSSGQGNLAAASFSRSFDNQGPQFTSLAAVSVLENTVSAHLITATDAHTPITYTLSGGADFSLFTVNAASGQLSFISAPEFASPADANGDNTYLVQVTATDSIGNASTQIVSVQVTGSSVQTPSITPTSSSILYYRMKSPAVTLFDRATFNISGSPNPDLSNAILSIRGPDSKTRKIPFSLGIRSTGTGDGQIQLQGSNILYEGVIIGTSSGVITSIVARRLYVSEMVLAFNSSATVAAVQALMRSLTFSQSKATPSVPQVSVTFFSDRQNIETTGSASTFTTVHVSKR